MKISILSDPHLGFGSGEARDDPFECLEEAVENSRDSDLILVAGDVFDTRDPGTETFTRAAEILSRAVFMKSGARLVEGIRKDTKGLSRISLMGIPVVAIHGTHERRVKGFLNPVEALEKAGFVIYLHCNGVVFQKGQERVCIQGLSGVPDQYAESALDQWKPAPAPGCFNVLMLHQSLSPFLCAPHSIGPEKLPGGFDLYVCGHMHESKRARIGDSEILIPGSFVHTQLRENPDTKGFWVLDTSTTELEFKKLERQRALYHREFRTDGLEQGDIEEYIKGILARKHGKKPHIRIRLRGPPREIPLDAMEEKFSRDAMLSFRRDFEGGSLPVKNLEEHKLSVQEMGRRILLKALEDSGLEPGLFEPVFELLLGNDQEKALAILREAMLRGPQKDRIRPGIT